MTQPTDESGDATSLPPSGPSPEHERRDVHGSVWLRLALLAVACLVAALAARLLALPPGYAAPMWPAAGIALAALLAWGVRLWPGVWLGAFLADLWREPSATGAAIAALDASGATLQALTGVWLARRLVLGFGPLHRDGEIGRLLFAIGPLASVVSASIGVATLYAFGRIEPAGVPSEWLLWWAGTTLGALLFAPIVLRLVQRDPVLPALSDDARVVLPLLITAGLLAAGNLGLARLEEGRSQRAVERSLEEIHALALGDLPTAVDALRGLGRFFDASGEVTRSEFAIYAAHVLGRSGLVSVDWAPRVPGSRRAAFEDAARNELDRDYRVFELDDQGRAVSPTERAEYFPVLFVEPFELNAGVLGLASGARAEQSAAMARARDTTEPQAAELVRLARTGRPGVVVFVPVFESGLDARAASVALRREALRGYVGGVFDLDALFFALSREAGRRGMGFRVLDVTQPDAIRALEGSLPAGSVASWSRAIEFAGRDWRLELAPLVTPWRPAASVEARLYLAFSVLAALLVAFTTLASASRRAAAEALVGERTAALARELEARRAAEAALRASERNLETTLRSIGDGVLATDLEGRITHLNTVAERLTGWTQADAYGRPIDEVFLIINEHSRQPAPIPVEAVLRTGEIHGLANHTVLIARDGTEYAIADSAAPIVDGDGTLRGVVLVFRDVSAERATELALEASEARYRQFVERSPYGVFVQCGGRFAYLNPKALELLGATREDELIGREVIDFVHHDSRAAVRERIRRLNGERSAVPALEEKWLRRDGTVFDGEATAVPYEHDGRPGALVLLQDITARKAAEEERDRFFALSIDLLCIASAEGHFVRVNPAFTETLGWSERELLARPFFDFVHPDDVAATRAELERLRAGIPTRRFENRYRCRDGSWRRLAWNVQPCPGGLLYASAHDTTEQHEARQRMTDLNADLERRVAERGAALDALHAKEEEIHAVVDHLIECVVTIDERGTIRSANPAVAHVLGYRPDEVVGRNVAMLMPGPHARLHDAYLARYRATGEARIIGIGREVEGLHKDGHLIPLELAVNEYRIHGERLFIGTLRDIRERKTLIAELTRARVAAEEASRAKSAFLATMSHEIRTPMNGVIGLADVLANTRLTEHQTDLVRTIRDSAGSLLGIIDDILDFSKIEAGRLEIERAPVSLADLVEGLCNSLVPVAARRCVDLALFVSPLLPARVLSDDVRLRQVLYNLVGNAIKFSSGRPGLRGRVAVRVEPVGDGARTIAFRIADNGIGIEPEALGRLFSPFSQAEVSTTRRFGGTGLGLAICSRLVELMHGEIDVESTPEAGSTFTVRLPLEPAPGPAAPAAVHLDGIACVIVDSDELAAKDLRAYLEHAGARVEIVADVGAAAQAAASLAGAAVVLIEGAEPASPSSRSARPWPGTTTGPAETTPVAPSWRRLLITRGRRRRARVADADADTVTIDGDALRRDALLRAVAVAAGRASPELAPEGGGEVAAIESAPALSIAAARAQGRLILVAEDDEINQKVILQQLALLGCAAEIAPNGAEALRLSREARYALLLTDLHMPEMDGYTLAESIRRDEAGGRPRMPIVALTANALRGEASRARAVGIDDYLTKPVQLNVLRAALEKWLPARIAATAAAPPPAQPATSGPAAKTTMAFDPRTLAALVGDDPSTLRAFLRDYLDAATDLVAHLRSAAAEGETATVGALAHRLKSSSRAVGALPLGDLCAELENAGRAGDRAAISTHMKAFEAAFPDVEAGIRDMLRETP